jgi:hypothetical protein
MGAIRDPAVEVAARFLADLRSNTARTVDQRADPAWRVMAPVALDLFGPSAGEAIIIASRLAARSSEEAAADRAEIGAAIEALGGAEPAPPA